MKYKLNTFEDKLRNKTRRIVLMQGAYGFLMASISIALLFYAFFILAYLAPQLIPFHIPEKILIGFMLMIPVIAGIAAGYFERRDTMKMTLKLEKQYPHLQDRLLTIVELQKNPDRIEQNSFSRALAKSLEADMTQLMDRFSFNSAAQIKRLILPALLILCFFTAGTVHAYVQPDFFTLSFKRLTQPMPKDQKPFALFNRPQFEIKVIPGDAEIAKGSNLIVQAMTPGYPAKKATLRLKKANETAWEEIPMQSYEPGSFSLQLNQIMQPYVYTVRIDRHESPLFQIRIFENLRMEKVMWKIEYPAYTKIKEQTRQGWGGKMTVPKGTKLHLDIAFNQPVKAGRLLEKQVKVFDLKPKSGRQLTAEITADRDYLLTLDVNAENGETSLDAPAFWIQVLPDLAPYMEILEPQQHNYVFPTQEIPFEINANDDYGLKAVDLVIRYQGKEKRIPWLPKQGGNPDTIVLKPVLKLEELDLHSRDMVVAYLEIQDTYPEDDPAHKLKSELFVFLIRDYVEQYKVNLPPSTTLSVRQYFEDIMSEQEKIMADTWDYISQPPREGPAGWETEAPEEEKEEALDA